MSTEETHVIRQGRDPKRGKYWGLIGDDDGNYGWCETYDEAETFTAEDAVGLAEELTDACIAIAIADIDDDCVAP